MRTKIITALALLLTIVTVAAGPAAAARPVVVDQGTFDDTFVLPAGELCDVEITGRNVGTFKVTDYVDADGNLVRSHILVNGTSYLASEFGEAFDRWVYHTTFDPETLTNTQVGNVFNVHAGAGGVLVNDSGRIVIDVTTGGAITINGPHQAWHEQFGDACAALAP